MESSIIGWLHESFFNFKVQMTRFPPSMMFSLDTMMWYSLDPNVTIKLFWGID